MLKIQPICFYVGSSCQAFSVFRAAIPPILEPKVKRHPFAVGLLTGQHAPGYDTLTVNAGDVNSYTLVDEKGKVLNSRGSGGTYIIVKEVERITVLGADGIPLFFWSQAGALPAINQLLLLN